MVGVPRASRKQPVDLLTEREEQVLTM